MAADRLSIGVKLLLPLVLILIDLGSTALAGVAAIGLRSGVLPTVLSFDDFAPVRTYTSLVPALGLLLLSRLALGLYPGYGLSAPDELRRQTVASLFVVAAFAILGVVFRFSEDYSRVVLAAIAVWLLVCLPIVRAIAKSILCRAPWYGIRMLVMGHPAQLAEVVTVLRASPTMGIRPVPVGADLDRIQTWPRSHHILVIPEGLADTNLAAVLDCLTQRYQHVWLVPKLLDLASAWVSAHDLRGHLALELRNNLLEPANRFVKRLGELLAVIVLAPIVSVLMVLIALAIRLDSRGPVFFIHTRIGKAGKAFGVYKFRTMHVDSASRLARHVSEDQAAAEAWRTYRKLENDPRVTRIGAWLRRSSLDELPQFVNIIRGEMSLVGPRAITRDELHHYGNARHLYTAVLPGLTGLWQVSGRNGLTYEQRVRLDTYYVRNWSMWLDLVILSQTPLAVLKRQGAY